MKKRSALDASKITESRNDQLDFIHLASENNSRTQKLPPLLDLKVVNRGAGKIQAEANT